MKDFDFNVYSRRWGHNDYYSIRITDKGWYFSGASVPLSGECDKTGKPFIFKTFDHELINYPKELGGYFEWLWEQIKNQKLSNEEIQKSLNMLAEWINICEKNSPKGIWETFK